MVFRMLVHGDGPERVVVQRRIGRLPTGKLVARHRMRADVATVEPRGRDLVAYHAFDAADIGERRRFGVEGFPQCRKDLRHRLQRIAQHQHVGFRLGERAEAGHASYAVGFGGRVGAVVVVPCGDFASRVGESARQRASDEAKSHNRDFLLRHHHISSLLTVSSSRQCSGGRRQSSRTPP